jgi:hypothetical protein
MTGFKIMQFADVPHDQRIWLIRHHYHVLGNRKHEDKIKCLKAMNATDQEIDEAFS